MLDNNTFWALHDAALISYKQRTRKMLIILGIVVFLALITMIVYPTIGNANMAMAAGYHWTH